MRIIKKQAQKINIINENSYTAKVYLRLKNKSDS